MAVTVSPLRARSGAGFDPAGLIFEAIREGRI